MTTKPINAVRVGWMPVDSELIERPVLTHITKKLCIAGLLDYINAIRSRRTTVILKERTWKQLYGRGWRIVPIYRDATPKAGR
jgi:hypothetical protein